MHQRHNTAKRYTTGELKRILVALQPDAIFVELFAADITSDGTVRQEVIEKAYSPEIATENEVAKALGVRLVPIEREDRQENWARIGYWQRARRLNDHINDWLKTIQGPDCLEAKLASLLEYAERAQGSLGMYAPGDVINSEAYDCVIRAKRNAGDALSARFGEIAGYPEFEGDYRVILEDQDDRNRIMAENIERAAQGFPAGRVVVCVGSEHRYALRELLSAKPGIAVKEFWEVLP